VAYTAVFRDGPLGGQFREMPDARPIVQVPVFRQPAYTDERYSGGSPITSFDAEEYQLMGTYGRMLEYRWRNPADSLRDENRLLREKIAGARAILD